MTVMTAGGGPVNPGQVTISPFVVLLVGIGMVVALYSFSATRPVAVGFTVIIVLGYLLFYYPEISSQIAGVMGG
ncbi:MAG: hypothetical protein ACYCT2_09035 [Thermoplasmataceae archaeon]